MQDKKSEIIEIKGKDYILYSIYGKCILFGPLSQNGLAHNLDRVGEFASETEAWEYINRLNKV